jgi:rubredoxin
MTLYTHPDPDRVFACPECDTTSKIHERTASNRTGDERFRCYECGHRFEEAVDREMSDPAYDQDDIPRGLDESMKQAIRAGRESD